MFNTFLRKFYSYADSCDAALGTYNCDPCPLVDREFGRVRGVALIKKSYLATLLAAPTVAATWTTGISAGNIVIVPMTAGSYDPGDQKVLKGYGDNKESYGTREMTVNWFDPNYAINYAFYNSLADVTDYVPAFRTSSLVHIFDTTASLTAKDPVEDDVEAEVIWNGIAKVISKNIPTIHDAGNLSTVFACN
jgi:hypothetical protein